MRDVGNDAAIAHFKRLIFYHHLSFICLLEPLINSSKELEVAHKIGFNLWANNCNNKIWLFWCQSVNVSILCRSDKFLYISIFLLDLL